MFKKFNLLWTLIKLSVAPGKSKVLGTCIKIQLIYTIRDCS